MSDITPARHTMPPITHDVSRWFHDGYPEPVVLSVNGRAFVIPFKTHYVRIGVTQEGLLVEYQNADDGDWFTPVEITEARPS